MGFLTGKKIRDYWTVYSNTMLMLQDAEPAAVGGEGEDALLSGIQGIYLGKT